MTRPHAVLWTDGGSRGNPGPAGIGFVLETVDGEPIRSAGRFIGEATNNIAEYRALIWGLEQAIDAGVELDRVHLDSELLVKQLSGEYKVKHENMKPLYAQAVRLLGRLGRVEVVHVPRAENRAADALVNEALDAHLGRSEPPQDTHAEGAPGAVESKADVRASLFAEHAEEGAMYHLTVKSHFDAAHALRGYPGECRELHGHTWDVEVTVAGARLDEVGIVYDFKTLKDDLNAVLEPFDHAYLNEVPPFDSLNATAENLARVVYEEIARRVPEGIRVVEVAVWESPVARIAYRAPEN